MTRWVRACSEDDLCEGQMLSADLDGSRILLARIDGRVSATDLICTHADADLSMGFLGQNGVRCPLHLSVFDLQSGEPQNPPAERPLNIFNVKIEDGSIYVEV